jgi:hypothetical protein
MGYARSARPLTNVSRAWLGSTGKAQQQGVEHVAQNPTHQDAYEPEQGISLHRPAPGAIRTWLFSSAARRLHGGSYPSPQPP